LIDNNSSSIVHGIPILFGDETEVATAFKNKKARSMEPKREPGAPKPPEGPRTEPQWGLEAKIPKLKVIV